MALTATSRAGSGLGITKEDLRHPVAGRRVRASKKLVLHPHGEKDLVDKVVEKALEFVPSRRAVLVFLRTVEDVTEAAARLRKAGARVQHLIGTMRGFERDHLVREDEVLQRFAPDAKALASPTDAAFLVCTSAGEVGVNLSADHLVCDLSTFDSMVQRFGRVNRFGLRADTEIHVFHPTPGALSAEDPVDARRLATLKLLRKLEGQASPEAIGSLDAEERTAAFAPEPEILPATDILFDAWSMTSIAGKLPGRPRIEPYLHGVAEWEPPACHVAWREEVDLVRGDLLVRYPARELLDDYPLKPHELLSDRTSRVLGTLQRISANLPHPEQVPVWIAREDGDVETSVNLAGLLAADRKRTEGELRGCTLILPPSCCVPVQGLLSAEALTGESIADGDIADRWLAENGAPRRLRTWDDATPPDGMRLVRTVLLGDPEAVDGDLENDGELSPRRWNWYEASRGTDGDGSRASERPVLLSIHLEDVRREASRLVKALGLPRDLGSAVIAAAAVHDLGKRRRVWQRSIANRDLDRFLAKSGQRTRPLDLTRYRHELGSLLDAEEDALPPGLGPEQRDLALHLIAAHHGRGRPHFPPEELFDPEDRDRDFGSLGTEVIERFSRLQRRYGRWGLAYLESLLRAADHAASARPSSTAEENR
jgi:CRISPR-associated endonuclease/helicase Cas3